MSIRRNALLACATALLLAGQASANPVFFTSEAAFQAAAAGIALTTENFDTTTAGGFPQTTPTGIMISAVNAGPNGTFNGVLAAISGGSGQTVQFQTQSGGTSVTFDFSSPINAFGIDVFDLGTQGATDLTLTTANGSQLLFDDFVGAFANQQFAGVVDTMNSFTSVTIHNTQPADFVGFDDLQFGTAVPEPVTVLLLALGLIGASCSTKRRAV